MIDRKHVGVQIAFVLLVIIIAWLLSRFWLYPWWGVPDYAPMILRPVFGFLAAWVLLKFAGESWAQLGLVKPSSFIRTCLAAVILYLTVLGLNRFIVPEIASWLSFEGSPSIFSYIRGNTIAFWGWFALSWLVGAFCEELLFRGFLLTKVADLCGGSSLGLFVGVVAQAVLFGSLHWYQGAFGFTFAFISAGVFGVGYLASGRNLWPLIIVHGSWNSVAMYGIYSS